VVTRRRKVVLGGGGALLVAVSGLMLRPTLGEWATSMFFVPYRDMLDATPRDDGFDYEELSIPSNGSSLFAWWFPSRRPAGEGPRPLVLHVHGNAGNLSYHWMLAAGLADHGFDVLEFDYRGFGRSPGRVSRRTAREDVVAALDFASVRAAHSGAPLVVLAQSMGAALTMEALVGRADVSAVVLDAPFSSWSGIAWDHVGRGRWHARASRALLDALLAPTGPEPIDLARSWTGPPVMIVTGTADEVCPSQMAHELAAALPDSELLVLPDAAHVGQRTEKENAQVTVLEAEFFRRIVGPSAKSRL
jgi:hypothetical protein